MNTLERKVSEALRAYGEGLDMTTQDIDRLEEQLEVKDEAHRKERRGRLWQAAVAACAVTGVVLGALALRSDPEPRTVPASPPPLTLNQLAGLWANTGDGPGLLWLWYFTEDGRMTTVGPAAGLISDEPWVDWTVRPAPGGFTLDRTENGERCHFDASASMTAAGRMTATLTTTTPDCDDAAIAQDWGFVRISPVSAAGATLDSGLPTLEPKPVSSTSDLDGTWLIRGTGRLVVVVYERYRVLDLGEPAAAENGSLSQTKAGSFVFTPKDDPDCPTTYASAVTRGSTVALELAGNSCGRLGQATETWVKLHN